MAKIENVLEVVKDWCEARDANLANETLQRYVKECALREGGNIDWVQVGEKLGELAALNLSLSVHIQTLGLTGTKFSK